MTILTDEDRRTAVWKKIQAELERLLDLDRRSNDEPLDHDKTASKRGEIKRTKQILSWGNPEAKYESEDPPLE